MSDRLGGGDPEGTGSGPRSVHGAYARSMGEAGPYLFIGIQIAGAMLVFVLGGYFADRWLGTAPWLTVIGAVLGMVAVVGTIVRAAAELERQSRASKAREGARR